MNVTTTEPRVTPRWLVRFGTLSIVIGVLIFFHHPLLVAIGEWLNPAEKPRSADYVMILPGSSETRPFVATAMLTNGLAKKALVVVTESLPEVDDGILIAEDELTRQILLKRGVRPDQIVSLSGQSGSTFGDSQALRRFLDEHPDTSVAVVTSDFHVRRARWVFRRVLGDRFKQVFFVAARTDEYSPENWWQFEAGLSTYLSEYTKLAIYVVAYGDRKWWIVPAAVVTLLIWRRIGRPRRDPVASLG